jgi:hypothetical protein
MASIAVVAAFTVWIAVDMVSFNEDKSFAVSKKPFDEKYAAALSSEEFTFLPEARRACVWLSNFDVDCSDSRLERADALREISPIPIARTPFKV